MVLAGHEIRTPIDGVLGMAELLLAFGLNSEQREMPRIIQSSGEALPQVINDLLNLSKMEAGKLPPHAETFELESVILQARELPARQ